MNEKKSKKKKLTLSGNITRPIDRFTFAKGQNKTSVVIEKKIHRKKSFNRPNFKNQRSAGYSPGDKINDQFTNKSDPNKPKFNKNFELRRIAEQKATRRIKGEDEEKKDIKSKFQDKNKSFSKKREYKLTLSRALNEDVSEFKSRSLASIKRARLKEKKVVEKQQKDQSFSRVVRQVHIPQFITIQELANRMAEQASVLIKHLLDMGVTATINHTIDADTAEYLVKEFKHEAIREKKVDIKFEKLASDDDKFLKTRPPIVTVMGHVDHGKTSLLDALRETNVVSKEHGGITQHIGAYQVKTEKNKTITFIDTPGHSAFTEMRARGSKVTDIVVLVVAADEGVKPQTIEAINHAKAAKVPIVVAINKCDLPGADPQKIKNQLLEYELIAEEMSGETLFAEVSAAKKKNLDKLIENINLQSEVLELKANPNDKAKGIILESRIDKGRGPVSTILITNGNLKKGDFFVSGKTRGKVRAMIDHKGQDIETATPSVPVEILGMQDSAYAGDDFAVVETESKAKEINKYRLENEESKKGPLISATQDSAFENFKKIKELPIIIKSDVYGSSEAIKSAINNIKHDEVSPKIILSNIGIISETDVSLAKASGALLIGFNVKASKEAKKLSEDLKIKISYFGIIYEILDFISTSLSGLLKPDVKEEVIGSAEILEIFKVGKIGKVAGSKVVEGTITNNSNARLIRNGNILYTGTINSIFREKNAAKEVAAGLECGITLKNFADFKTKDIIEAYKVIKTERRI